MSSIKRNYPVWVPNHETQDLTIWRTLKNFNSPFSSKSKFSPTSISVLIKIFLYLYTRLTYLWFKQFSLYRDFRSLLTLILLFYLSLLYVFEMQKWSFVLHNNNFYRFWIFVYRKLIINGFSHQESIPIKTGGFS